MHYKSRLYAICIGGCWVIWDVEWRGVAILPGNERQGQKVQHVTLSQNVSSVFSIPDFPHNNAYVNCVCCNVCSNYGNQIYDVYSSKYKLFLNYDASTRRHILNASSVNTSRLLSGDVTTLPNLPLAIFFSHDHWTALLPVSAHVLQHVQYQYP